jgi:2-oxo-4-hydroxy-4-carboxy--5-ureidoimidazoline (OHCU) decarboxylase
MLSDPRERYWRTVEAALARPEQRAELVREFPELADLRRVDRLARATRSSNRQDAACQ